jgi:glycosyltransferase involved in cell wall biosynthesis
MAQEAARRRFDLPPGRKIVFFGAQSLKDRRKGLSYLAEALHRVRNRREIDPDSVMLITSGRERDVWEYLGDGFPHRHLGFLDDEITLAAAYQAADLFVCPSIEDSGPMMINEAIMCGTPVVSFAMGVAQDLVHTGKTGYRAELRNSEDLAHGMATILKLDAAGSAAMSQQCRRIGLESCHPRVQVDAFLALFRSLLPTV